MTSNAQYRFLVLAGVLLVSHAVYWFTSGRSIAATDARTAAVIGQIVAGLALALWAWRRDRAREHHPLAHEPRANGE